MMCLTRVVSQVKVGLNPLVIDDASLIEIESTSKGFLPSRMTSAQRDLQPSWEQGHIIYNLTDSCLQIYDGAQWDCFIDGILIDSTIYKYDGSLSEDRTLSLSGSNLTFSGTNNVTFESSGELGIGAAAPDGPLHIVETTGTPASASDGSVIIEHGDAGGASSLVFKSESDEGNDYGYIQYQDDGSGNGSTSENSLLTIGVGDDAPGADQDDIALLPSGNVGIGTTTPAAKLDVATGTVRFSTYGSGTNTGDGLSYLLGVDADGDVIEVDATSIGSDDQQIDSLGLVGTELQIGIEDDAIGLRTLDLSSLLDHDWYIANTTNQSTSISDDIFTLGNVGIGTNQPFAKLQVSTENSEDIAFTRFDNSGSDDLDLDFISGLGTPSAPIPLSGASSGDRIAGLRFRAYVDPASVGSDLLTAFARIGEIAAETDGTYSATSSPGKLVFSTTPNGANASIERMTIKNDGKVGIGTGLPDELLHVAGNMRLDGALEDKDGQAGTNGQVLVSTMTGTDWVDASTIDTDTDNQTIDSFALTGNILAISLEDDGEAPLTVDFSSISGDSDWLKVGGGKSTNILDTIYTFGNVGINRNDPQYPLHLDAGNASSAGPWVVFEGGGNVRANTALQLYDKGTAANNELTIEFAHNPNTSTATPLAYIRSNTVGTFHANGADLTLETKSDLTTINLNQLVLESDGDVGIGTRDPAAKLDVDGGSVRFSDYGGGSLNTGNDTYLLGVEADGDIVEVDATSIGSDDQQIDSLALTGTTLEIGVEDDANGLQSVDLAFLRGGSIDLHDDVDVTTTTPTAGDILAWDGANFVPQETDNGYTIFNVWAEESAALDGGTEWAYGNGDNTPPGHGIVIPVDCELWAMSLDHEDGTNTTVGAIQNSTLMAGYEVTTSGTEQGYNVFSTPLVFNAGDVINFETISATPTGTSGRVSAWFRIRATPASNSLLEDLMDVSASSITTGQILVYDGASFVPGDDSDDQQIDSFALNGNILNISLENDGEAPLSVDLSTITGSSDNIYNTNGSLDGARTVTLNSNNLTFDGTGTGDVIIESDGDVGIGTTTPSARLDVQGGSVTLGDYGTGTHADTANVDYILVTNTSGEVKELNTAKNTRWFYPPAVIIDASDLDTAATLDLHADYVDQFGTPLVSSDGASSSIPYYQEDELEYHVTFYDDTVLDNISIDANGVMTYDVIAVPFDNYTVINVVFLIKDP